MKVDLNCDLGESFGRYTLGLDDEVIKYITSANIACGFHASDPCVMASTIKKVIDKGVSPGAHPGYPDLLGFGRRNMDAKPDEVHDYIIYQIGALDAFAKANGSELVHVKPHGALYNSAAKNTALAEAICHAIYEYNKDLILLCPSGSQMAVSAKKIGIRHANEVFADRGYQDDGSLVPRNMEGAFITDEDEAVSRIIKMVKKGTVVTNSGKEIDIKADSICLHGDGAKAVEFAKKIREALLNEGIELAPLNNIV